MHCSRALSVGGRTIGRIVSAVEYSKRLLELGAAQPKEKWDAHFGQTAKRVDAAQVGAQSDGLAPGDAPLWQARPIASSPNGKLAELLPRELANCWPRG